MKFDTERREYKHAILDESTIHTNPFQQFNHWMEDVISKQIPDPTAMALATVDKNGFPQARIVLLKDYSSDGFTFFTNYRSEKARAIEQNNKVSLHFYWHQLERQVRISGTAHKTSVELSKSYFHSRPQKSQIAAAISEQSKVITSRRFLEEQFEKMANDLKDKNPDYPENWGGYRVKPIRFEFWQGRESRLHDRIVYELRDNEWEIKRLAP